MSEFDPTSGGGLIATVVGTLLSAAAGWRIYRSQSSNDAVTRANNEANVSAIETYKDLLETERAARKESDQRADRFAEERNEAWKEVYKMQGQIEALTRQVEAQNLEIARLRDDLHKTRPGVNDAATS